MSRNYKPKKPRQGAKLRDRGGAKVWVIDFRYKDKRGEKARFRQDAQVQNREAADKEYWERIANACDSAVLAPCLNAERPDRKTETGAEPASPKAMTFGALVADYKRHALGALQESTQERYGREIETRLLPAFANEPIDQPWFKKAKKLFVDIKETGLSDGSVRCVNGTLHAIMRYAVDCDYLTAYPKLPPLGKCKKKQRVVLTVDEFRHLLAVTPADVWLTIALLGYCGLRWGELRALNRGDVILTRGKYGSILVRRSMHKGKVKGTKSGDERFVPLAEELRDRILALPKSTPDAPLATNSRGKRWGMTGFGKRLQRLAAKAGIERHIHPHGLRHFCITRLQDLGVPAHVVRKLVDHKDLETTERYTHAAERDVLAAADAWGRPAA